MIKLDFNDDINGMSVDDFFNNCVDGKFNGFDEHYYDEDFEAECLTISVSEFINNDRVKETIIANFGDRVNLMMCEDDEYYWYEFMRVNEGCPITYHPSTPITDVFDAYIKEEIKDVERVIENLRELISQSEDYGNGYYRLDCNSCPDEYSIITNLGGYYGIDYDDVPYSQYIDIYREEENND